MRSPVDKAIGRAAGEFFQNQCHIGLSIGVSDRGVTRFYNYGTTRKGVDSLPTQDSVYEIASLTKSFTGTLAARALIESKMTLDSDFRAHLGAYPNLERNGRFITLRQLALHSSGMPRDIPDTEPLFKAYGPDTLPFKLVAVESGYDRARYMRELSGVTLAADPGANRRYSNIGIKLIGFGLENAYRQTFAELIDQYVTGPLGMRSTFLTVPARLRSHMPSAYGVEGKPMPPVQVSSEADGGLHSTTSDLIRFANWHLDESDNVIQRSHEPIDGNATDGDGLIWHFSKDSAGRRLIHQSGGSFGMSSLMLLAPQRKFAVVLLANDGCLETQDELELFARQLAAPAATTRAVDTVTPPAARIRRAPAGSKSRDARS